MAIPPLEPHIEGQTDLHPLLMERPENRDPDHVIDIQRSCTSSWSNSSPDDPSPSLNHQQNEERPSSSTRAPVSQPSLDSSDSPNSRNSSFTRRNDGYGRRRRSPLNSGMWISIELLVTLSQIVAAIVVLSLSRHENPQAPLFAWIVGYASGCVATLPLLYWRFLHRNQGTEEDSTNQRQGSSHSNPLSAPSPFATISVLRASDEEDHQPSVTAARNGQGRRALSARVSVMVDHFKMALDCFFAVWFVVGNVWIFGGHSSSSEAPNLYRLCIVFLTFSCIGYAMPFILCATICCCLPCIISILGFREDLNHNRGATAETINVLPTYKFKLKKNSNGVAQETNSEGVGEGGVLAAGTEKERVISGEDAVCCICLAKYADNEDLRELPCTHFFHVECVDKWLKINALCPLCKSEIVESSENLQSTVANSSQLHSERRVGNGSTEGDAYGTTVF